MSRFYATAVNGRGNTVGIGGRGNAGQIHLRGWQAGVRVVPVGKGKEPDKFRIYMTHGSSANSSEKLLGTVHQTPDGPQFITAGDEMSSDAYDSSEVEASA